MPLAVLFFSLVGLGSCVNKKEGSQTRPLNRVEQESPWLPGDLAFLFPLPTISQVEWRALHQEAQRRDLERRIAHLPDLLPNLQSVEVSHFFSMGAFVSMVEANFTHHRFLNPSVVAPRKARGESLHPLFSHFKLQNWRLSAHRRHANEFERWKILGVNYEPLSGTAGHLSLVAQPVFSKTELRVGSDSNTQAASGGTVLTPLDMLRGLHPERRSDEEVPSHLVQDDLDTTLITEDFALHLVYRLEEAEGNAWLEALRELRAERTEGSRRVVGVHEGLGENWRESFPLFAKQLRALARGPSDDRPNLLKALLMTTAVTDIGEHWVFSSWRPSAGGAQGSGSIRAVPLFGKMAQIAWPPHLKVNERLKPTQKPNFEKRRVVRSETVETQLWKNDFNFSWALSIVGHNLTGVVESAEYKQSAVDLLVTPTHELANRDNQGVLFERLREFGDSSKTPTGGPGCVSCHGINSFVLNHAARLKGFPQCLLELSSGTNGEEPLCGDVLAKERTPEELKVAVGEFSAQNPDLSGMALNFQTPIVSSFNFRHLGYYLDRPSVSLVSQLRAAHHAKTLSALQGTTNP